MSDSLFDRSIAAGEERGLRIAGLDAAVEEFQGRFLGLCGEFLRRMDGLGASSRATFTLCVSPPGQVSVFPEHRVTLHQNGNSTELSGSSVSFARALLGNYETAYSSPADIVEEADRLMALAEQSMADVLGERAALNARNRTRAPAAE